ncbi:hypothetical protein LTR86_003586 [Recurvomyces mirabilis]|nr:hypothetical protein LTR86_003586 [Recurvomyces mirabilis]
MHRRSLVGRRALTVAGREPYICPTCLVKASAGVRAAPVDGARRSISNSNASDRRQRSRLAQSRQTVRTSGIRRHASNGSLASATAINAPTTVPAAYRDLHQRLLALEAEAGTYISLSRLQLAIRSLESDTPVTRIALLGLGINGAQAARKLARVLLSDALGDEQEWETDILRSGQDGRSLLLRYGDVEDTVQQSPLMQTLSLPSPFLRRHNVEILVTIFNTSGAADGVSDAEIEEALLVPSLVTPNSSAGRVGFVRYPVHRALVVAEGITGAVEYGRLPRFLDKAELILSALSLPLRSSTGEKSAEQTATDNVIDIDLATHALGLFRANKAYGAQFSEEWQTSRVSTLSQWISGPPEAEQEPLRPAIRSLMDSVLLTGSAAVEQAETTQLASNRRSTVPEATRTRLNSLVSHFAADWHRDLQTNLQAALESRTWSRTAWFCLLWRIDDVSVSASDVLRQSWLTEAEQTLAFLSGRIEEAGLATSDQLRGAGTATSNAVEAANQAEAQVTDLQPQRSQVISMPTQDARLDADIMQVEILAQRIKAQTGVNAMFDPPWPRTINLARQQMLHSDVPQFHRKAQALLLSTISTAGGSTALGAWIWLATNGAGIQYAGALAALGIVWSLRRLQSSWGKEREAFATSLKEAGRTVLADVELHLRKLVKDGGRTETRVEDLRDWQQARAALQSCREAAEKIR